MSLEILRSTVRSLIESLVRGEYESVIARSSASRLTPNDLREVIRGYGRTLVASPERAYDKLDTIQVRGAVLPTWSVRAPLWTLEEGRSDLTLEVTISFVGDQPRVELEDLHVL